MTHQAAIKATATITAATVAHMAEQEGIPIDTVLHCLAAGDANTWKRLRDYLATAVEYAKK